MGRGEPESTQTPAPMGLGRKRRHPASRPSGARRRAAVLCALLGLGIWFAGQPEFFWGILSHGRPGIREDLPHLPAALLVRTAEAAHAKGRLEEAARLYGLLLAQHPQHAWAENALALRLQTLVTLGRLEEAQRTLRQLQKRNPRSDRVAEALLEIAHARLLKGQLQQASRNYTDVVALMTHRDPFEDETHDSTPASAAARRARHKVRTRAQAQRTRMERVARFNLAVCQDLNRNRTAALSAYERFVRRFPTDLRAYEAYFRMGVLARETERLEQAVEYFAAVWQNEIAAADFRAASIYQGGLCLERLRRHDEARQVYALVTEMTSYGDAYRLATLTRLATLLRQHEPLRALEIYRELAEHSEHAVERAVAQQNYLLLQTSTAMATVDRNTREDSEE